MFDYDISSTGSWTGDFQKGFALPFRAMGEIGGAAVGGVFKGAGSGVSDAASGVGDALGSFFDGLGGPTFKYILLGIAAITVVAVLRK